MRPTSNPLWSIWSSIRLPEDFGTRKIDYSQPIIEPPSDPWVFEHCWPAKIRLEEEQ